MKHLIKGTTYDSVLNQINNGELKTKPLIISTQDDGGEHTIKVVYRKDSSSNSGADRGYLMIPYNQD